MARALVDVKSSHRVPVRLKNCDNEAKVIKRGTVLATVQTIKVVDESLDNCNDSLLYKLISDTKENTASEYHDQITDLVLKYQDTFTKDDGLLGRTDLVKHKIDTGDAQPIIQRAYILPFHRKPEADKQIEDMLKQDGSLRLCVDYRKRNLVTKKDAYPIPNIHQSL